MTVLGYQTLVSQGLTGSNASAILIGDNVAPNATSLLNIVAIGPEMGTTYLGSTGQNTEDVLISSDHSTDVAGGSASYSVGIGGNLSLASSSVQVGYRAGFFYNVNSAAYYLTLVGNQAGFPLTSATNVTAIGARVALNTCRAPNQVLLLGTDYETDCSTANESYSIHIGAGGGDIISATGTNTANTSTTTIHGNLAVSGSINNFSNIFGVSANSNYTPVSGGSGYAVKDALTLNDSCASHAVLTVTSVSSGAVAGFVIANPGSCNSIPTNPVSVSSTTGSGSGATFALSWAPLAASIIVPSAFFQNNTDLNIGNLFAPAFAGAETVTMGYQAGTTMTGLSSFNVIIGVTSCGGGQTNVGVIQATVCLGQGAGSLLKQSVGSVLVGNNALQNEAQTPANNIVAIGQAAMVNENFATSQGSVAVGQAACAGASGSAAFDAGLCLGNSTGGALTTASKFVIIGPNVGTSTFASGNGVILLGSGYQTVDTPAAGTSNYINIENVLTVTGTNTPSTSAAKFAGSLLVGSGTTSGQSYVFQSTQTIDPSSLGTQSNRYNMFYNTYNYSTNTTNIMEGVTVFDTVNGPGHANGEINNFHGYLQVNANGYVSTGETFESSLANYGTIAGWSAFAALPDNKSTGTITTQVFGFNSYLTNENTTANSVNLYAAFVCSPLQGGGSQPTNNFCLRNGDAQQSISTLGGVYIGSTLSSASPQTFTLFGADNAGGTFPFIVKNAAGNGSIICSDAVQCYFGNLNITLQSSTTGPMVLVNGPDTSGGTYVMSLKNSASSTMFSVADSGALSLGLSTAASTMAGTWVITGPDVAGGTYPLSVKNSSGTILFAVADSGTVGIGSGFQANAQGLPIIIGPDTSSTVTFVTKNSTPTQTFAILDNGDVIANPGGSTGYFSSLGATAGFFHLPWTSSTSGAGGIPTGTPAVANGPACVWNDVTFTLDCYSPSAGAWKHITFSAGGG